MSRNINFGDASREKAPKVEGVASPPKLARTRNYINSFRTASRNPSGNPDKSTLTSPTIILDKTLPNSHTSAGTLESAAIFCVPTKNLTGFRRTLIVRLCSHSEKFDHHAP